MSEQRLFASMRDGADPALNGAENKRKALLLVEFV